MGPMRNSFDYAMAESSNSLHKLRYAECSTATLENIRITESEK